MTSLRPNWDSPNPSPASECALLPPPNQSVEGTLTCGRGGGGVPIRTTGE